MGVAAFPYSGDSPQAVLKAAGEALYRAKEAGRNRMEVSATLHLSPSNPPGPAITLQRSLAAAFGAGAEAADAPADTLIDAA